MKFTEAKRRPYLTKFPCVIVASGPSLRRADVDHCFLRSIMFTINDSWRFNDTTRQATFLYAADPQWWIKCAPSAEEFGGERWSQNLNWPPDSPPPSNVKITKIAAIHADISDDPSCVFGGYNSSFQAMQLAVHFGFKRIVFLGLDCKRARDGRNRWHAYPKEFDRTSEAGYESFRDSFERVAPRLAELGIEVLNASRDTALMCFPRATIRDALS